MDTYISNAERLDLKNMIDEMKCENNTEHIRNLKHSVLIRDDIRKIVNLKKQNVLPIEELSLLCQKETPFLHQNYTDIFNKIMKDEIDLVIMTKLLTVLKLIEDGKVDQHEGSVLVGKILKELYLDSAVKHADNLDKMYADEKVQPIVGLEISWKEYKKKIVNKI
jgi:hypothetical protein